jgi:hypothetical protein
VQKVASRGYACHAAYRGMIALQTPYFIVHSDGAGFVVRLQRTGLDYPDIPSLERDTETINALLDRLGRDRKGLCIDWREGPLRNDEPFEEALRRVMPKLVRGYRAVAVIVRSAVGALQVKRHFREGSLVGEVFQDEVDAMDYLRGSGGMMSRTDRTFQTNPRSERMPTAQLQGIERIPPSVSGHGDRHSPVPSERPSVPGTVRGERISTVSPQAGERISQSPTSDDRPSSQSPTPPSLPRRTS